MVHEDSLGATRMTITAQQIAGIVLAGGRASRMGGGDKALVALAGEPLLASVTRRLRPQVRELVLNANGDPGRFVHFGLPIIADDMPGFPGPLAGILAGMEWAAARGSYFTHIATAAADTPFLPLDLVSRLAAAAGNDAGRIVLARSAEHTHAVFGLWPLHLAETLRAFLDKGETFKVRAFAEQAAEIAFADFPFTGRRDPFFNINTPDDLLRAEAMVDEET